MRGWLRFVREDRGAIAPLVAVALGGLLAVGAVAWDLSRGFALRAELEAAADAAALAGATQLDGTTGAVGRATSAAQGSLVQNAQRLGNTGESNVAVAGADISFLQDLSARTAYTSDGNANFIQINLSPRTLTPIFGAFARVTSMNVRAHAVAGYGSALCKVPPMMVCNPDETQTINVFGAQAGKGIVLNGKGGGGSFAPGNFGYLQVGANLSALQQAMGRSPPLSECFGDEVETRTGDPTSILDWYNMRFDIYANNTVLALKNDPFYAPAANTVTGLHENSGGSASVCKPANTGTVYDGSATGVVAMALPRDKCAYSNWVGAKCDGGANALGNGDWDRATYFSVNHGYTGALTTAPFTGDAWSSFYDYPGVSPKPTYPTRYQVYLWETANLSNNLLWGSSPKKNPAVNTASGNGDWATRQCSTATPVAGVPDRRTMSVIVLNCSQIQNNKPATVVGAVDLFLTEPAAISGNGWIFGEVIQSTSDVSAVGKETRLYSVRLYE